MNFEKLQRTTKKENKIMARVFTQTYTKPIPEGAEIFKRNGESFARYKTHKGENKVAPVSQDGKSIILETAKHYIEYKDSDGMMQKRPGFKDLKATEQLAGELERTAEHIRSGYKPKEHEFLNLPLNTHLDDFKTNLLTRGISEKQAKHVYLRAKKIIEGCSFQIWSDISASKIQARLAELRKDTDEKRGISAQTNNWYLQSIKGFCKWMVREGRAPENPIEYLKGINVKTDRRHDRRALTYEEIQALLNAALQGNVSYGMAGYDRAFLYKMALGSGLRASELKTLRINSCNLDADIPTLTVKACYSKHRREDIQPIPESLADELRVYFQDRCSEDLVFPTMPRLDTVAKMMKTDMDVAEIDYKDDAGKIVDFHALRHTYITNLARAGIHPKTAMDLARHGDINLTLARYSHTLVADRASALKALDNVKDQKQQLRATGTDDYSPKVDDDNKPNDKQDEDATQPIGNTSDKKTQKSFLNRRSLVRTQSGAIEIPDKTADETGCQNTANLMNSRNLISFIPLAFVMLYRVSLDPHRCYRQRICMFWNFLFLPMPIQVEEMDGPHEPRWVTRQGS